MAPWVEEEAKAAAPGWFGQGEPARGTPRGRILPRGFPGRQLPGRARVPLGARMWLPRPHLISLLLHQAWSLAAMGASALECHLGGMSPVGGWGASAVVGVGVCLSWGKGLELCPQSLPCFLLQSTVEVLMQQTLRGLILWQCRVLGLGRETLFCRKSRGGKHGNEERKKIGHG